MMDLLQHLIPDFAHMFSANPNGGEPNSQRIAG